jgi:hypothetical protein
MGSIGEQIAQEQMDKAKRTAAQLAKPAGKGAYKGLCLIVKAEKLSTKTLIKQGMWHIPTGISG